MLRSILSIVVFALLLSFNAFAKDMQKACFSATMEGTKCKNKNEKALKKTDGVEKVSVDLKEQSVKVEFDKNVVSEDKIAQAINSSDSKFNAKSNAAKKSCSHDHKKDGAKCKSAGKGEHKGCNKPCKKH